MGVLRKLNNYWYIDLRIHGKRIRKRISQDKQLAKLALQDLEVKTARNELGFLDRKEITVSDFFARYKEYSKVNHRPGTIKRYKSVLDNFQAFVREKESSVISLSQITSDVVEKYKAHRKTVSLAKNGKPLQRVKPQFINQGAKSYTINFELGTLRTALYLAIQWGYLQTNPLKDVIRLKTDDSQRRRFLTSEECQKLLNASIEPYYGVFYALLNTGMRLGELVNLEWNDLDLEKKIIKIQKKSFWLPKTGERIIPINEALLNLLKTLPQKSNFIFLQRNGKPLRKNNVRNVLISTAKKAEIANLTQVHSLRHTFASHLLMKGADLPSVQKLMGHSKIETTMIYTHQTESHLREAVHKLTF